MVQETQLGRGEGQGLDIPLMGSTAMAQPDPRGTGLSLPLTIITDSLSKTQFVFRLSPALVAF